MAANVTIKYRAFSDPRIAYLGQLAGYSTDEALGRLARLWSICTERQNHTPDAREIRACLGPRGDELIVEAGLGERLESGAIRVRGCEGSIEWFGELGQQQQKAGKARVAGAPRDAKGRLLPRSSAGPTLDPADSSALDPAPPSGPPAEPSAGPAPSSALDPATPADIQQRPASESESESGEKNSLPRAIHGSTEPGTSTIQSQEGEVQARARRALRDGVLKRLNAIREQIATKYRLGPVHPLHHHGNERDLAARHMESLGDPKRDFAAECDHVLAIAEAEADAAQSVQYLTGALFTVESFRRAMGMTVRDAIANAQRKRAGPRSNGRADEPPPRKIKTL